MSRTGLYHGMEDPFTKYPNSMPFWFSKRTKATVTRVFRLTKEYSHKLCLAYDQKNDDLCCVYINPQSDDYGKVTLIRIDTIVYEPYYYEFNKSRLRPGYYPHALHYFMILDLLDAKHFDSETRKQILAAADGVKQIYCPDYQEPEPVEDIIMYAKWVCDFL